MKTIGEFVFPTTHGEARLWKPAVHRKALARNVLVVARTRAEGKWEAYCDAVPGKNHDNEEAEVLRVGCKLVAEIAVPMFPCFDGIPYAK